MKNCRNVWLSIILCALGFAPATEMGAAEGSISADDRIRKAVEDLYIHGLQTRNFELITTICIPEAVLMGSGSDGVLHMTTLEKWSHRFDPENPPFLTLDATIEKIDRVGTAAQVRVLFVIDSKREVTDFLNMVEIEGRWRIVNIIDF